MMGFQWDIPNYEYNQSKRALTLTNALWVIVIQKPIQIFFFLKTETFHSHSDLPPA